MEKRTCGSTTRLYDQKCKNGNNNRSKHRLPCAEGQWSTSLKRLLLTNGQCQRRHFKPVYTFYKTQCTARCMSCDAIIMIFLQPCMKNGYNQAKLSLFIFIFFAIFRFSSFLLFYARSALQALPALIKSSRLPLSSINAGHNFLASSTRATMIAQLTS